MNGNEKLPRRAAKITTARPLAAGATIADGVQTRGNTCCGARPQGAGATRSEPRQEPLAAAREVDGDVRTPIRIMQMDCPTEEGMIRKKLASLPAVTAMEFNLMQRVLMVVHRPDSLDSILAAIRSLGFTPQIAAADAPLAAGAGRYRRLCLGNQPLVVVAGRNQRRASIAGGRRLWPDDL